MKEPEDQREVGAWIFDDVHVILDTRSPGEFEKGHIHGATCFPLFENDERAVIGTLYKQQGKDIAVEKGLEFVGPKMSEFVRQAKQLYDEQSARNPLVVHCWRGGMRSGAVAWLLETAGIPVIKLIGGYKAYRAWSRRDFQQLPSLHVLGGMTGVGKTQIIHALESKGAQVIDLEGIAGHLGSAFGNLERIPQPTSEQFSNACHRVIQQCDWNRPIWVENESRVIGKVYLPEDLFDTLRVAPVWAIERTETERVDELCRVYGDAEIEALKDAFGRIQEKLGGARYKEAIKALDEGDLRSAAEIGLVYYDKLYHHTQQRYARSVFTVINGRGFTYHEIASQLISDTQSI